MKFILILLLFPALSLAACAPKPADCKRADVYCAGLVTDFGPINEGINQEAWRGLQDAKDEHLVDRIDAIETIDVRDQAKNISSFADLGYDVIITVGSSITDETTAAAQKYPGLLFIGVEQPQDKMLPNLTGLVFREDQSGFVSGALAAMITQTHRVAALCESKFIDPMRRYCDGFQAGAKYSDPGVNVSVAYRDGPLDKLFNDLNWGSAEALSAANEGADVLFAAGGNTADAALETAAQQNIDVIGAETDPYDRLTDIRPWLVTSAISDIRAGVHDLVVSARSGKLPSGNFYGQTQLAPFHAWESQIPQSYLDQLNLLEKGLKDGSIKTGIPWLTTNPPIQNP